MANRTCAVAECDRPTLARGWCSAHYKRWKKTGSVGTKPLKGSVVSKVCIVAECERPSHLRGWCRTHYHRWRETGEAGGAIAPRSRNKGQACKVADCDREAAECGWCRAHYQRWWRHGDEPSGPILMPSRWAWKGDDITYSGMHMRLRRVRGDASNHLCVDCYKRAEHWSYNHGDENERIDSINGSVYSTDMEYYEPRCASCHWWFDNKFGNQGQLIDRLLGELEAAGA